MKNLKQIQHEIRIKGKQLHQLSVQWHLIREELEKLAAELENATLALNETTVALDEFNSGDLERSAYRP